MVAVHRAGLLKETLNKSVRNDSRSCNVLNWITATHQSPRSRDLFSVVLTAPGTKSRGRSFRIRVTYITHTTLLLTRL